MMMNWIAEFFCLFFYFQPIPDANMNSGFYYMMMMIIHSYSVQQTNTTIITGQDLFRNLVLFMDKQNKYNLDS